MSLRWYRRPRLVVLKPDSPVLDAARAIGQNRIGAVVVQDKGRVVGILTDRDLATRVLALQRDPAATKIADVMTTSPSTLTPANRVSDAIRLMQDRNVRRIPLVENGRVVGMVTLDDLLLDEAAPQEALAAIVQSQIGEGGPYVARSPARRRSLARAEATLTQLLSAVRDEAELESLEQARTAVDTVLTALVRRLIPQEAGDLIAQLPSLLQPALRALPPGPDRAVTEESIQTELCALLGVEPPEAARILAAVAGIIAGGISEGQAEDVRGQLPAGLRDVFRYTERFPLFV
ncbi:MAG TPA: CBS domain-containing protein [Rhodanobacteraceae bacterium]|nr:CBS domain-containing protein [Rhodanobacteraceae bacterium]